MKLYNLFVEIKLDSRETRLCTINDPCNLVVDGLSLGHLLVDIELLKYLILGLTLVTSIDSMRGPQNLCSCPFEPLHLSVSSASSYAIRPSDNNILTLIDDGGYRLLNSLMNYAIVEFVVSWAPDGIEEGDVGVVRAYRFVLGGILSTVRILLGGRARPVCWHFHPRTRFPGFPPLTRHPLAPSRAFPHRVFCMPILFEERYALCHQFPCKRGWESQKVCIPYRRGCLSRRMHCVCLIIYERRLK